MSVENKVIKIRQMDHSAVESRSLYSAHIFVFPFKWRITGPSKKINSPFHKKVDLKVIEKTMVKMPKWKPFSFGIQPEADHFNSYNEYTYFHDYARDILGVNYKAQPYASSTNVVRQYDYNLDKTKRPQYIIQVKSEGDSLEFVLDIEGITLNFYESGIGVLAFHLKNFETGEYQHILKINEYGRRIYPQFLGGLKDENPPSTLLDSPQWSFLPEKITLLHFDKPIVEDFGHYATRTAVSDKAFVLPAHIKCLLGDSFKSTFDSKVKEDIEIIPVLDDRMFVMCFYRNSELMIRLAQIDEKRMAPEWQISGDWYRFVFVDDSKPSITSPKMMQELLTAATYERWYGRWAAVASDKDTWVDEETLAKPHEGMIFGITRYSFVLLTSEEGFLNQRVMEHHFSNLYFQLALLTLVQRASVLSFSAEANWITSHLPKVGALSTRTIRNIAALYLGYIQFINKIYFREVTPQEQGLELYNKLQTQLCIKTNVEDLQREMGELHQFVETQQQRNISWITYIFLPVSIVLSFFGLNYFGAEKGMNLVEGVQSWYSQEILTLILILAICLIAVSFFSLINRRRIL